MNNIEVISGSMKFEKEMGVLAAWLEMNGNAVYRPQNFNNLFGEKFYNNLTEETKKFLLKKHQKNYQTMIRHASRLHVIAIDGYIGESTKEEIKVAEACKIPIKYYDRETIANCICLIGSANLDLLK